MIITDQNSEYAFRNVCLSILVQYVSAMLTVSQDLRFPELKYSERYFRFTLTKYVAFHSLLLFQNKYMNMHK
jgi:hypothetical protein